MFCISLLILSFSCAQVLLRRVILLLGQWNELVPADMRVLVLRQAIVPALGDGDLLVRPPSFHALNTSPLCQ